MNTSLPVVHVKESHALKVDPEPVSSIDVFTLAVPPYARMTCNDKITLTWQGVFDDGFDDEAWTSTQTVEVAGRVLYWSLDISYVAFIANGSALVSYSVEYADSQAGEESSPVQTFTIVAPDTPLLPRVLIDGLVGDSLDPEAFPEGLVLKVAAYTDIQIGDDVLLYASGGQGSDDYVLAWRVDQRTVDAGEITFTLEPSWLQQQLNETVDFAWQYARPGAAGSSDSLELQVKAAWRPAAPSVIGAQPELRRTVPGQGYIDAFMLRAGAKVLIPEEAGLSTDDVVEVHWQGQGETGSWITNEADPGNLLQFSIPPSAVPANMGKRLTVIYTVARPGEPKATSRPFDLRIVPLPVAQLSTVQCACVDAGTLRLSCVPDTGAEVTLNRWMFMAERQLVTIRAESSVSHVVLEDEPVTSAHLDDGKVTGILSRAFLESLGEGTHLSLKVRVSFDDGYSYTEFPTVELTMAT
ncbi:hypothetical protein [Pseudomonas viridiflava]